MKHKQPLLYRARENFPVASWLLPKKARASILAFYAFARGADTLADDPSRTDGEKLALLTLLTETIAQAQHNPLPCWSEPYLSLIRNGILSAEQGTRMLSAFTDDVTMARVETIEDLLDYCMRSAATVGRTILQIFGEAEADLEAADALSSALQILNHMQDCREDFLTLGRIYIPQEILRRHRCEPLMLGRNACTPELRAAISAMLDIGDRLIFSAARLPASIRSRRLRIETAWILAIAGKLSRLLRIQDPLALRVELSKPQKILCLLRAMRYFRA